MACSCTAVDWFADAQRLNLPIAATGGRRGRREKKKKEHVASDHGRAPGPAEDGPCGEAAAAGPQAPPAADHGGEAATGPETPPTADHRGASAGPQAPPAAGQVGAAAAGPAPATGTSAGPASVPAGPAHTDCLGTEAASAESDVAGPPVGPGRSLSSVVPPELTKVSVTPFDAYSVQLASKALVRQPATPAPAASAQSLSEPATPMRRP